MGAGILKGRWANKIQFISWQKFRDHQTIPKTPKKTSVFWLRGNKSRKPSDGDMNPMKTNGFTGPTDTLALVELQFGNPAVSEDSSFPKSKNLAKFDQFSKALLGGKQAPPNFPPIFRVKHLKNN